MQRTEHGHWRSREVARLMALVEAERRYYEDLLTILPYPVAVVSAMGEMQSANRAFLRRFRIRAGELDGVTLAGLLPGVEPRAGRVPGWELLPISRFAEDEGDLLLFERPEPPEPAPAEPADPGAAEITGNRGAAAATGRLAGRVLHEVNNLLMVFSGYGEEILQALPEESPLREDMRELLRSTDRIRAMAGQLQECARPPKPAVTHFELGAFLAALAAREPRLAPAPGAAAEAWVAADRGHLEQALLELARYARQPLAPRLAGATLLLEGFPGPAEALQQDLEPLSAASRQGGGVLGALPALLAQSGIGWRAFDGAGGGATLELRLPAGAAATPEPQRRALVVDDEEGIRQLVRKVLERGGYAVIDAPSGEAALELLARESARIDILVTDMMMPGMTGRELATRVRSQRPETRVLFISGYTEDSEVVSGRLQPGTRFLAKPFQHSALLDAVTRLLAE